MLDPTSDVPSFSAARDGTSTSTAGREGRESEGEGHIKKKRSWRKKWQKRRGNICTYMNDNFSPRESKT